MGNGGRRIASLQLSLGIHIPLFMDHSFSLSLQATDGGESSCLLPKLEVLLPQMGRYKEE